MAKAKAAGAKKVRELPAPTTVTDSPLYTLTSTIASQFNRVVLMEDGDVKATLFNKKGNNVVQVDNVGSVNLNYICGLIIGATAGRGDQPDGAAIWAAENANQMKHLDKYTLHIEPAKRGTTLEAPVPAFKAVVAARSAILVPSLEAFPPPKRARNETVEDDEEEPDVIL